MKIQPKSLILYFLVATTTILAVFFFIRSGNLRSELKQLRQETIQAEQKSEILAQLIAVDSLLISEDYARARQVCVELLNQKVQDDQLREVIQRRIRLTKDLSDKNQRLKSSDGEQLYQALSEKTTQIDSLTTRIRETVELGQNQLDSLSFALEKANIRIESLSNQLESRLKSDYLKITREKGTQIHYVGNIKDEQANGWGVALYSTGSRYEGQWKNNMRHGEGVFYWPDGEYYQGHFELDQRHGQGKYFWPNGDMFSGEWKNDKRNGPGTFYGKDGKIVASGTWKNNELVEKK